MSGEEQIFDTDERARHEFRDDASPVFKTRPGQDEEIVRMISAEKNGPKWMLEFRLQVLKAFLEHHQPLSGHP